MVMGIRYSEVIHPKPVKMRIIFCLLLFLSLPALAEFSVGYRPAQSQETAAIANQLRQGQTLEKLTAVLNRFVSVPGNVAVVAQSCNSVNAYYSSATREVVICYELLTDHALKLQRKYGRMFDRERLSMVLASELTFVLLHEVGHAVFDIYNIPVLGREEDAADSFATFILLETNGTRMIQNATLFVPLMKTPWIIKTLYPASTYGDEHSLSEQRLANVICWGYGKDPQGFLEAAQAIKLPQNRAVRCAGEYEKMDRNVRGLLGDKLTINKTTTTAANQLGLSKPLQQGAVTVNSADIEPMLDYYKCGNCHGLSDRKIGPAFLAVAARYRGQDVAQQLVYNIKEGSSGNWGAVPAPPMHQVAEIDAFAMVSWILSLQ